MSDHRSPSSPSLLPARALEAADRLADVAAQYFDTGRGDLDGALNAYREARHSGDIWELQVVVKRAIGQLQGNIDRLDVAEMLREALHVWLVSRPDKARRERDICLAQLKRSVGPLLWISDPGLNDGDLGRIADEARSLLEEIGAALRAVEASGD